MPLFDAHNHLADPRLAGLEDAIFEAYREFRVESAVANGTCPDDWPAVAALAARRPSVLPSYGLHPWEVACAPADWRAQLSARLDADPRAGVGEIGLDRWMRDPDLPAQREAFRWQLDLAARGNRPTTIHCLQAWGPLLESLRASALPGRGFLMHSYGGSTEMARELADLGGYFSISGYFAHDRKSAQAEVFKAIPLDRLLVETDAPDMLGPARAMERELASPTGEPVNHPANIGAVYRFAAELRGMDPEAFEAVMAENWRRFFGAA